MQPGILAPLRAPLTRSRVALITASGAYVDGQTPFDRAGDHSFREIPADTPRDRIVFGAGGYDHADVNRDPNCMLPLDRLRELAADGLIGGVTETYIGFQGGGGDADEIRNRLAPAVVSRLEHMHADAVLLTGG